ncbi:hypothetical protein M885DRAFT_564362 [Pelagophyceae sp. CCMP2097]|nr:hypothetical protein M885DRAFT_564362 [Pelagophyceae sp. CCMP2097]
MPFWGPGAYAVDGAFFCTLHRSLHGSNKNAFERPFDCADVCALFDAGAVGRSDVCAFFGAFHRVADARANFKADVKTHEQAISAPADGRADSVHLLLTGVSFTGVSGGLVDGFTFQDVLDAKLAISATVAQDYCLYKERAQPTPSPSKPWTKGSPTFKPTSKPTNLTPTQMPTNALTDVDVEAAMYFFTDLTAAQFLADPKTVKAFRASLATIFGLALDKVAVRGATQKANRRSLLAGELKVEYSIQLQLRGTAGSVAAAAAAAFAALAAKVIAALADGSYASALAAELLLEGSSVDLGMVDVASSIASFYNAVVTVSAPASTTEPPTAVPTAAPTAAVGATSSKKSNDSNTTVAIIIVVVVGGGVLIIGAFAAWLMLRGGRLSTSAKVNAENTY